MLVVIGTRPEAIKLAPVVEAFRDLKGVEARVALTGQHTTLVEQVLRPFSVVPDHDLAIMRDGQTLYDVAERCLAGLRSVVQDASPDLVLVQGDTATVFFASLVAFFERLPVGHVEAGLRSGQKWSPYPEEIFRRLTDQLTDLYFAPTPWARDNLLREGVDASSVFVTGNTVVDALLRFTDAEADLPDDIEAILAGSGRVALLTAHRRESFGEPLRRVFRAVRTLVDRHADLQVVYPVHPNPNVMGPAQEILGDTDRIHLIDPVGYIELVRLLSNAQLVLTDSGGIQEEAPTFGVPVLVLREVTERPEGIEAGVAQLVGTDPERILAAAESVLDASAPSPAEERPASPTGAENPYGDGRAGERIADIVASHLTGRARTTADWLVDAAEAGHP